MKIIRRKYTGDDVDPSNSKGTSQANGVHSSGNAHSEPSPDQLASKKVAQLLQQLTIGDAQTQCDGYTDMAALVTRVGFGVLQANGLLCKLRAEAEDKSNADAREGALLAFTQLCQSVGRLCEPYVVPLLPLLLERLSDKALPVRAAADGAGLALMEVLCPHAVELVLPVLFEALADDKKWQTKEGSLKLLKALAKNAPRQVRACLPDIVPLVSERMVDAREQVKQAAWETAEAVFDLVGNRDIAHLVPEFLSCIARPVEVPHTITRLSATTFVQSIEAPALAVMVPLLSRGLKEETVIKRKTCVIIANMAKLVNSPVDAALFLPRLMPGVERVSNEVADPEVRSTAGTAYATLERVAKEGAELAQEQKTTKQLAASQMNQMLRETVASCLQVKVDNIKMDDTAMDYVSSLTSLLVSQKCFEFDEWSDCLVPYLSDFLTEEGAEAVCRAFLARCVEETRGEKGRAENGWNDEAEEEEELCNCEFSLAYGGKILLNNAQLRLRRGRRYGLCGANGVGKSTLMRAIANGKVDGFPPEDQLRTVYVEHDIQASLADLCVLDFIAEDPKLKGVVSREEVASVLKELGFTDDMLQLAITTMSGGRKMKLALARAMLLKADILLLDEPTNHLDVENVNWLENYLVTHPNITSIIVSHDSGFLDHVCTDIVHYESRQLVRYKGTLSDFVNKVPKAKSYYELEAATLKFHFPNPGLLDGITSKEKPILRMSKVGFKYPSAARKALSGVTLQARLSSRVAVLGVNGAGKSTLIKLMTGELKAEEGNVIKHPNLRIAYVAQHAFHHIEEHLEITPNKYFFKRFSTGEDKEEQSKVDRKLEDEDKEKMAKAVFIVDGYTRYFDKIVSRRKKKRDFEYEVSWQGLHNLKFNRWFTRDELIERGFGKVVKEFDGKKAAAALGNDARPLTKANVEKFLQDFGLEPEFGTHSNIRGLSGGQKVKLVLAAAMWNNPHLLIMDEPTNYLDREALGALANAINEFQGGVVVISHNSEFINAICNEIWHVKEGQVTVERNAFGPQEEESGP